MKKILLSFLFYLSIFLYSETLQIQIRYLGLTVVNVSMLHEDQEIVVSAKATGLAKIAAKMDNIYQIKYRNNFIPYSYEKIIDQGDYFENRITFYDHVLNHATEFDTLVDSTHHYNILPDCRDFFSALFFLRTQIDSLQSGTFWLDANNLMWEGKWEFQSVESIHFQTKKIEAKKIKLEFKKESDKKSNRSDMLTNNLVSEDHALFLWFSKEDKIPVKAKFKMTPFSVSWIVIDYEK